MKKAIIGFVLGICLAGVNIFPAEAASKIKVVSTIGQITNMVEEIGKDHVEVQGLMGAGVDPHLYRASESDVMRLAGADIIFYCGLHLESKMGEVFERMTRTKTVVLTWPDGSSLSFTAFMANYSETGPYNDADTFEITLNSSGTPIYVPA